MSFCLHLHQNRNYDSFVRSRVLTLDMKGITYSDGGVFMKRRGKGTAGMTPCLASINQLLTSSILPLFLPPSLSLSLLIYPSVSISLSSLHLPSSLSHSLMILSYWSVVPSGHVDVPFHFSSSYLYNSPSNREREGI